MSSKTIYHKHHIIPKHMGGTDDPSNLVLLTVEEHAQAHKDLFEKYGHWQDEIAWKGLSGMIDKQAIIKEVFRKNSSGKNNNMYGRSAISEQNLKWYTNGEKTVYSTPGEEPEGYYPGRTIKHRKGHSEETKKKLSIAARKPRACISPSGKVYPSLDHAAEDTGKTNSSIRESIKRGVSGWRFLE